jgi:hypothetical protein
MVPTAVASASHTISGQRSAVMRRAFGFGQSIDSAFPIPGALSLAWDSKCSPGLVILRDASATSENTAPAGFSREDNRLRLTVPGLATYLCSERAIVVAPCGSAASADVSEVLIASALPAALWMQGRLVLHAAAVCNGVGAPAVGILGRSGAGKSTLAAHLVARGTRLLADDSIAIAGDPSGLTASGLPGGLFLRADSGARQFRPLASSQTIDAARLGAFILLDEAATGANVTRLSAVRAIEALLTHLHRARAPNLMNMQAEVLRDCAKLAQSIPVYACRASNAMLEGDIDAGVAVVRTLLNEESVL